MWRTVIVTQGEKLTVRDNWLVVWSDNTEQRVPIRALVVTEKQYTSMRLLVGEKLATENLLDSSDIIEL